MNVVKSILKHEGFRAKPYPDPLHGWDVPTFGHGLTYITESESKAIVRQRVMRLESELANKLAFFYRLPDDVQNVLIEMAYQMGVAGVMKFQNMLDALAINNFTRAASEMIDSRWAAQTPERARDLAIIVRAYK